MHGIHLFGAMSLALVEVDAEMAVKIVVVDCSGAVGHAVHGRGVHMAIVFDQHGPAFPAPVAIDALHDLRVGSGLGFRVDMVGAAPPLHGKDLARLNILDLEGRAFGNLAAAAVEPVQTFRLEPAGGIRGGRGG